MLWLWVMMAAVVYFVLLACILVFFAGVDKMNRHWERVLRDSHGACDEEWHRAA
jgi:hypothetical protein